MLLEREREREINKHENIAHVYLIKIKKWKTYTQVYIYICYKRREKSTQKYIYMNVIKILLDNKSLPIIDLI